MYRLLIILQIISLQAFAQSDLPKTGVNTNQYTSTISSDKSIYHYGETPKVTVEIKNNSGKSGYLVKALDGSESKWRFPYAYFTITKAGDTSYKTKFYGRCGNMNEIEVSDFDEVKPGASFNPYKIIFTNGRSENIFAYDFKLMDIANFSIQGKYVITFYYSTMENDFTKWRGRFSNKMNEEDHKKMTMLFALVPKISIVSDELLIEIK